MLTFVSDLTVVWSTVLGSSPLQADGLSTSMSAMRHPPFSPAFDIELLLQHVLFLSFAVSQNDTDAPVNSPRCYNYTRTCVFTPSLWLHTCRQRRVNSDSSSVIYFFKNMHRAASGSVSFYIRLQKMCSCGAGTSSILC